MLPSILSWKERSNLFDRRSGKHRWHLVSWSGVFLLLITIVLQFSPTHSLSVLAQSHTQATVNSSCDQLSFSPDGNPYPLCPGTYPLGGNCVWWAWEQWHLLGYNLPADWGNAADWEIDAERSGFAVGAVPLVGSIAVFPRGDGAWAFGPEGHVAFVTSVGSDGLTFNVTYQNYGDLHPMYIGTNYNVSVINQPQFQAGMLRFIYFPRLLDPNLFARLPGIGNINPVLAVEQPNSWLTGSAQSSASGVKQSSNGIALGLSSSSSAQEFNADFTGEGYSDLLLYNRSQGTLKVLKLDYTSPLVGQFMSSTDNSNQAYRMSNNASQQLVSLGDGVSPAGKWGSSLDIHIGNFAGSKNSDILLYDRTAGTIQLLSLNTDLTIKRHMMINNVGTGWEFYVGRFNGQSSGVFMYKRFALPIPATIVSPPPSALIRTRPTVRPQATPRPRPTPTPTPTATPSPTPTIIPTPRSTVAPAVAPTATPKPTTSPAVTPTPKPTTAPTSTPKPAATPVTPTSATQLHPTATPTPTTSLGFMKVAGAISGGNDLSGVPLQAWEQVGRTTNVQVIDFNQDFSIHDRQVYTLWHSSWEVYAGHFISPTQDGLFLYDRTFGEGRLLSFNSNLTLNHFQQTHNLNGNWVVYSGDFAGSGRAQLLFYDPGNGNAQTLSFAPDLSLEKQQSYAHWGTNQVLYVGHFGTPSVSIMLYDQQQGMSTFLALDKSLNVSQQYLAKSWDQHWQILSGDFLDRFLCQQNNNCATGDDILLLNRQTGQIEQYVFTFGRTLKVYDNRVQSFARQGLSSQQFQSVNTTTFDLVASLSTSIKNEELY